MPSVKDLLIEMKDMSELMVDLAYSAVLFNNKAAAEEVINTPVLGADTGVVTTQSETDAFNIIRAIASEIVAPDKVCIRDAKSYCAILFDDNNRKPICRLFFNNEANKAIVLFDGTQEEKVFIHSVEEIFSMKNRIIIHHIYYTAKTQKVNHKNEYFKLFMEVCFTLAYLLF